MEIKGAFEIAAPIQRVWDSFWDGRTMRAWIPGCQAARWESDERLLATVEQSVAQLKAEFSFDLQVVEQDPPRRIRLQGRGEGVSSTSGVTVEMSLELSGQHARTTRVSYVTQAEIFGRLAKIGAFVIKIKAKEVQKQLARQVKDALEAPQ